MDTQLRTYILEKEDLEFDVLQYIETLHGLLIRLMMEVKTNKFTPENKKLLEDKLKDMIFKGKDYTNPKERQVLIQQLGHPVQENILSPDEDNREFSIYEAKKFIDKTVKNLKKVKATNKTIGQEIFDLAKDPRSIEKTVEKAPSMLGKIKAFLSHKYSKWTAAVLVVVALAFYLSKLRNNYMSKKREYRNIIENDVNPVIYKLAVSVIRESITNENSLSNYIGDLKESIVKKYFIKRDW